MLCQRIRESMWRVDPDDISLLFLNIHTSHPIVYPVPATLSLWHLDGSNMTPNQLLIYGKSTSKSDEITVDLLKHEMD